ncbi:MAG: phenylalanine--tRNA ligase subunit beta, partial [Paludibacteraceae bacterium]|nr:phenylalanine--tRNA ligase subunit beta [Paludibacteraceae bacterium]
MNVSYKWLKNYINLDLEPEEVSKTLTSIGLEIDGMEEIQTIKGGLAGLVVGQVLECEEHPDSDHLHVTKVDLGNGQEPVQIVCGAANCRKGLKTIVATIGTKLYDGDKEFTIKKSKLRGVESNGMLCAEDEIGVGNDHNGIIELPEDAKVGTPAKEYYHLESDALFVVDITPNRIDAASHYGVARDLNAYFGIHKPGKYQLSKPDVSAFKVDNNSNTYKITVDSAEACPRYTAVTISGVEVKESPEWLKGALQSIGIRSINNIVDVTNYVMMAMGQPLHAYDADQIAGKHVIVKTLPQGTKFTTLDGVERELDERDLMVCDENGPMCIAGVFGGEKSGTTEKTKNVLLESAYFNPVLVRKTARRHGLSTDASFRFERGCDPNGCDYNLKLAALLIKEVAGGTISSEVTDLYPNVVAPFPVDITFEKINNLTGKEIAKDDIHTILKGLEIKVVSEDANGMKLEVPTYRVDVQRDCDVIEDLLRIYGYDNIECSTTLHSSITYSPKINSFNIQNMISEQLTGCGFQEIMNNSLTKSSYYTNLKSYPAENLVMLMNPLSSDLNCMRQTLLFGGLESIEHNVKRKSEDLKF